MTRTMTILALVCCLVVGVLAAAMFGRDFVFAPDSKPSAPRADNSPVANRDAKADRLPVMVATKATVQTDTGQPALREAFADDSPVSPTPDMIAPIAVPPLPSPRPKAADLPPPQKSYSLLSDMQIAALKERLQLTPAQAPYWPPGIRIPVRSSLNMPAGSASRISKKASPWPSSSTTSPACPRWW